MEQEDYEYRGLIAQTWDLFRGDTSDWDDRFQYLEIIRRYGQPALDVGCGTGRLLLDYLSQGIDVDGVDISPDMLALCREKAQEIGLKPNLYQQAMEALDLPRKYRTILVPSSSIQLLLDPEQARQAMGRFHAHLMPGGVLAMPFMNIWKEGDPIEHTEWKLTGEKVRPEDGATVRRWSLARYDVTNQLEHTEDKFEVSLDGKTLATEHHRRSPATRWYTREQAIQLYEEAGLTDIQLFRFERTLLPALEGDDIVVIIGTRP